MKINTSLNFRIVLQALIIVAVCMPVLISLVNMTQKYTADFEECTIGVAAGSATSDGRPLVWKTRDTSERDNEVVYFPTSSSYYSYIAVTNAGSETPWMGVNEKGFAIVNSYSPDLPSANTGDTNGTFMAEALWNCATLEDFEALLNSTAGIRSTRSNFAVIDTTGAAAIYETSGYQHWKYDANNSSDAPNGYIVKTNFAHNGDGSGSGMERYNRTGDLISDFFAGDSLNYKSVIRIQMRDFSDSGSDPVSVPFPGNWSSGYPYGYIYTSVSICRNTSVSATVVHGTLPGEPAKLSTMWTILGQPATSIAVPYWAVGETPSVSNGTSTAPLSDRANQIREKLYSYTYNSSLINSYKLLNGKGDGIWKKTFPAEDSIFTAVDSILVDWRTNTPTSETMLSKEEDLADYAYSILGQTYEMIDGITDIEDIVQPELFQLHQNYPNPFNPLTTIKFNIPAPADVSLKIYNITGQMVKNLLSKRMPAGLHNVRWDGTNSSGMKVSSGTYIYTLKTGELTSSKKMVLLK